MSGLFQRIDSLLVQELMDYTTLRQRRHALRHHGLRQGARRTRADGRRRARRCHLPRAADASRRRPRRRPSTTSSTTARSPSPTEAFDIKAGRIEAGTVSAQRFGYTAIVAGRRALTVEHITRLGDDQAPDWPTGRGWKVTVEGRPSMVLDSHDRHARRGRDRSGLPWHRHARRARHRSGVRGGAGNPYVP